METLVIDRLSQSTIAIPSPITRKRAVDHDIEEIAVGFGRAFADRIPVADFSTTTRGPVTYRRIDPLCEPFEVADRRLQSRLEMLCETLRAKY